MAAGPWSPCRAPWGRTDPRAHGLRARPPALLPPRSTQEARAPLAAHTAPTRRPLPAPPPSDPPRAANQPPGPEPLHMTSLEDLNIVPAGLEGVDEGRATKSEADEVLHIRVQQRCVRAGAGAGAAARCGPRGPRPCGAAASGGRARSGTPRAARRAHRLPPPAPRELAARPKPRRAAARGARHGSGARQIAPPPIARAQARAAAAPPPRADRPNPRAAPPSARPPARRNGRKSLTTVQGLKKAYDYKKVLKALKKEFCCNGNVVDDPELGQVRRGAAPAPHDAPACARMLARIRRHARDYGCRSAAPPRRMHAQSQCCARRFPTHPHLPAPCAAGDPAAGRPA
jgi:hypothetical protein